MDSIRIREGYGDTMVVSVTVTAGSDAEAMSKAAKELERELLRMRGRGQFGHTDGFPDF